MSSLKFIENAHNQGCKTATHRDCIYTNTRLNDEVSQNIARESFRFADSCTYLIKVICYGDNI